ncbi:MAG: hypothetical protein EP335_10175 [Alphaproteobacteria bacterium]|nr:MAG: hypothetical protein EP335_10175 [Alphaproteobacteria bacterium]
MGSVFVYRRYYYRSCCTHTIVNKDKQIDRFKEAARQIGADENNDALDRAFGRLSVKTEKPETPKSENNKKADE